MPKTMGRPVANKYKVPKTTWRTWNTEAQKVFNYVFYSMRPALQFAFLHPQAAPMAKRHWETTRYNAAYTAAEAVMKNPHPTSWIVVENRRKRRG